MLPVRLSFSPGALVYLMDHLSPSNPLLDVLPMHAVDCTRPACSRTWYKCRWWCLLCLNFAVLLSQQCCVLAFFVRFGGRLAKLLICGSRAGGACRWPPHHAPQHRCSTQRGQRGGVGVSPGQAARSGHQQCEVRACVHAAAAAAAAAAAGPAVC